MVPIYFRFAFVLFNLRSTFSYMYAYFSLGFDSACEPLDVPIRVSTPIEDSIVVDRMH